MKIFVGDTETTGITLQDRICDVALIEIDDDANVIQTYTSMIDPEMPIPRGASDIHHILDHMVWDQPTIAEFMEMHGNPLAQDEVMFIAHNVNFDLRYLGAHIPHLVEKLDTVTLARRLWPSLESHKMGDLVRQFDLEAGTAHRAHGDTIAVISLLRKAMETTGVGVTALCDLNKTPMPYMTWGKHKGTMLEDLPKDYVQWLLDKATNVSDDLRAVLKQLHSL